MATRRRGWIGVDVGTRAIKLAQLEQADGGLRLVDAVAVPRARPAFGQALAENDGVGCREEVRAALSLGRCFRGRAAACTISMHWCQTKSLQIAAGRLADERSAIARELDFWGCAEGNHLEFDYWETRMAEKAQPDVKNVIFLALRRGTATEVARDLSRCGLDCRVLDALPLALARAVRMISPGDDPQPVAALDWGFGEATFCAISGPTPTFVRRLRGCGFGYVLQQVGKETGLSTEEIEALLTGGRSAPGEHAHSASGQLHAAIPELAAEALRGTVEELRRTLTFLKDHGPAPLPGRIWLSGAGTVWNGAGAFLASRISCPVETWRLQDGSPEGTSGLPFPEAILASAISLSALAWSDP